jgi:hypothetical protein
MIYSILLQLRDQTMTNIILPMYVLMCYIIMMSARGYTLSVLQFSQNNIYEFMIWPATEIVIVYNIIIPRC